MLFIARRQRDHELRETGDVVHLLFDGKAGPQVVKFHGTGRLGQNREGEGIPFGKDLSVSNVFAVLNTEARTVNDVVAFLLAALFIDNGDEARPVHGDERASTTFDMF